MASVLIVTPTYSDAMSQETRDSVGALRFDGRREWAILTENPFPPPDIRNVVAQYQHARTLFLAGDYDALLTVEHDMIPPPDGLKQLWSLDVPVAYGVYLLRHGTKVLNALEYIGDRALGDSLSLRRAKLRAARASGAVRVSGIGFGFTLMRRAVVERFPFHDGRQTGSTAPDLPFARDCVQNGVEQWAHFGVPCGHYSDGRILWPLGGETGNMQNVIALQGVVISVNRQTMRLVTGGEYTLPGDDAAELARAGYVQLVVERGTTGDCDASVSAPDPSGAKRGRPARAK